MVGDKKHLKSRFHLVLHAMQDADSAYQAINNIFKFTTKEIRPFNLVAVDTNDIFYYTNSNNSGEPTRLDDQLILLNRSCPNDFSEKRIQNNYFRFLNSKELDPDNEQWLEWEKICLISASLKHLKQKQR
jgi:hypothetical protein